VWARAGWTGEAERLRRTPHSSAQRRICPALGGREAELRPLSCNRSSRRCTSVGRSTSRRPQHCRLSGTGYVRGPWLATSGSALIVAAPAHGGFPTALTGGTTGDWPCGSCRVLSARPACRGVSHIATRYDRVWVLADSNASGDCPR